MEFKYNYASPSSLTMVGGSTILSFSPDLNRKEVVSFQGTLKNILDFRDAMLSLREVVISDLRTPVKDRSAYLAWAEKEVARLATEQLLNQALVREQINQEIDSLEKEKEQLEHEWKETWKNYYPLERPFWKFIQQRDHDLWMVLDPVITVHPDIVSFEAFSNDESTYACLAVNADQFEMKQDPQYGTTNIDFSRKLGEEFLRVRSYNPFELSINPEGFTVEVDRRAQYLEKKIDLPESWVRGFLQVSSAAAIPGYDFVLNPIDIYLICSFLRRHREHWSPRALRYELKPNMHVRVIFEPWEEALELSAVYSGPAPQIVRTWGRRRLFLLERLIPLTKRIRVRLLGGGMPAFYVVELPGMNFTLGLSGWVAKDWSGGAIFNALSGFVGTEVNQSIIDTVREKRSITAEVLRDDLGFAPSAIGASLGFLFRHGLAYFDIASGQIRFRMLSQNPLPPALTDPSPVEIQALALMTHLESVKIKQEVDKSLVASGQYKQSNEKECQISFKSNSDGILVEAHCTCSKFKKEKMAGGPCEHILALQLYALATAKVTDKGGELK